MARQTKFGLVPAVRSNETVVVADPTKGYDYRSAAEVSEPGSLLSGQNCWVLANDLLPRYRLQQQAPSSNPFGDVVCGAFNHDAISGLRYQVAASNGTVAYLNGTSWATLVYSGSTPFTGNETNDIFGVSVFLPRIDDNITIIVNGVDNALCWSGPSRDTLLSSLTGAPVATDVTLLDSRPVFWNVADTSATTRFMTRLQWTVRGDPEDSTSLGAGSQDLVDMRGQGTRIFTMDDQLICATDKEIWAARVVGDPFIFDPQPLVRTQGIPFKRAALRVPFGVVWLGDDYMVYLLETSHSQPKPIGQKIHAPLRATLGDFSTAFFGYSASLRQLTLYYTALGGAYPQRAFTCHIDFDFAWTPHTFAQPLVRAGEGVVSSSATTWGGLTGTLGNQALTYNQFLGLTGANAETLYSSAGTAYAYGKSATSDDGQTVLHEALIQLAPAYERYYRLGKVTTMLGADSASSLSVGFSGDGGLTVPVEQRLNVSANSQSTSMTVYGNVLGSTLQVRLRDDTGGFWHCPKIIGHGTLHGPVVT